LKEFNLRLPLAGLALVLRTQMALMVNSHLRDIGKDLLFRSRRCTSAGLREGRNLRCISPAGPAHFTAK